MHFKLLGCVVRASKNEMLAVALLESNLYQLDTNVMNGAEMNSFVFLNSCANLHFLELWHKRLGHLNANNMETPQSMVSRMDVQAVPNDMQLFACKGCIHNK